MEHSERRDELSQQLALYAIDALDEDSAEEWSAHLATGCRVCQQEFDEFRSTLALLPYGAPAASPSQQVKTRLFQRVRASSADAEPPPVPIDFSSLDWRPLGFPGVSVHWLRRDEATGAAAAFLKIEPGCVFPGHRHPGGEESLVLQGRCRDARGEYQPGSYMYYQPGSVHADLTALEGDACIVFVTAPGGIELLQAEA